MIVVLVAAWAVVATITHPAAAQPAPVAEADDRGPSAIVVDPNAQVSSFFTGATMTQFTLDPWGNDDSIATGKVLLEDSTAKVAQHLHGFGGVWPYSEDGTTEDWLALDRRFNGSMAGVDTAILSACCAPEFMELPFPGIDSGRFSPYLQPAPEFYQDYADVVLEAVQRYPSISHIQVWNEMKGFYNISENRWDYEAYTEFYNTIWNTVKPVRPDILIGGPYVALNSYGDPLFTDSEITGPWGAIDPRDTDAIKYWMENKAGADFLVTDGDNFNVDEVELVDPYASAERFVAFVDWFRSLDPGLYEGADYLPVWWSEWYAYPSTGTAATQVEMNAVLTNALIRMVESGTATAMVWGPQGDVDGLSFPLGLFNDTRIVGGGQATPLYETQKFLNDHARPGMALVDVNSSNPAVAVLETPTGRLVLNTTNSVQTTTISGAPTGGILTTTDYTLNPFEVQTTDLAGNGTPPTATIRRLGTGRFRHGSSTKINVLASDDEAVANVTVTVDGEVACVIPAPPWDCKVTFDGDGGDVAILATARDAWGNAWSDRTTVWTTPPPGGSVNDRPVNGTVDPPPTAGPVVTDPVEPGRGEPGKGGPGNGKTLLGR